MSVEIRPWDIMLGEDWRWGGERGPGPCGDPVWDLRRLIEHVPATISHFRLSPKTAKAFLAHPSLVKLLPAIESRTVCGTLDGEFTVRGLGTFRVRAMEDGIVLAIGCPDGPHDPELARLAGAIQ